MSNCLLKWIQEILSICYLKSRNHFLGNVFKKAETAQEWYYIVHGFFQVNFLISATSQLLVFKES